MLVSPDPLGVHECQRVLVQHNPDIGLHGLLQLGHGRQPSLAEQLQSSLSTSQKHQDPTTWVTHGRCTTIVWKQGFKQGLDSLHFFQHLFEWNIIAVSYHLILIPGKVPVVRELRTK